MRYTLECISPFSGCGIVHQSLAVRPRLRIPLCINGIESGPISLNILWKYYTDIIIVI